MSGAAGAAADEDAQGRPGPGEIAVLDVGKTNVKLVVTDRAGRVVEALSTPNPVLPGPPWDHHDLGRLGPWVGQTLAALCLRHPIEDVIPVGHGVGAVLVAPDPDASDGTGTALPMMDYEQACPPEIDASYAREAGDFAERGSAILMASTHSARQLWRMQTERPADVDGAGALLHIAQYWAWWLSGVMASEQTMMGAQSHFRHVPERRWTGIVTRNGWERLMPPFRPAWDVLGPVRPALAARYGLPATLRVHTGAHDSSAHFYRYRAAGLTDITLVSTGTWIVALSAEADVTGFAEDRGLSINADPDGNPVGGAITMGGRAFSTLAGADWAGEHAEADVVVRLIRRGTMALPNFMEDSGQFPGSGGKGRIVGPPPETQAERTALAVIHAAQLTLACAAALSSTQSVVLDGTFLSEPLYAPLVAAFAAPRRVIVSPASGGVAAGAALMVDHEVRQGPVPLQLAPADAAPDGPDYADYAARWTALAQDIPKGTDP